LSATHIVAALRPSDKVHGEPFPLLFARRIGCLASPAADTAPTRKPPHCNSKRAQHGMPCSPGGCHRAFGAVAGAYRRTSLNMMTV
jgi:hypothetical protein